MHRPVLVEEVLKAFEGVELKIFFDGTLGGGGHAKKILEAHPEIDRYLGCDRDLLAHNLSKENLKEWKGKVEWIHGGYSDLSDYLDDRKIPCVQGFLFDIGLSSMQLLAEDRGFSFQRDALLDMRMDVRGDLTAEEIVNSYPEKELARIFSEYGEEPRYKQAARAIVEARRKRRIQTTQQLVEVIGQVVRRGKLHPATLVFQALRIAVNDELGELTRGLNAAVLRLCEKGRVGVISFHSLEDRIVKQTFREKDKEGSLQIITKKPIVPTREEIRQNPRSRSAKLRVAEKIYHESTAH